MNEFTDVLMTLLLNWTCCNDKMANNVLEVNWCTSRERNSAIFSLPSFSFGSTLKGKNLLLKEQMLCSKSRFLCPGKQAGSHKSGFSFCSVPDKKG